MKCAIDGAIGAISSRRWCAVLKRWEWEDGLQESRLAAIAAVSAATRE